MRRYGVKQKVRGERVKVRGFFVLSIFIFQFVLHSCEGTTFQNSVPAYPVHVLIDTRIGSFVHFQPTVMGSYVEVNKNGYFLDGQYVQPVSMTDAWGYGGVLAYVSMTGYNAYDLACPYCASRGLCRTCTIDGANAVCPECGEEYDLMSGLAMPRHGISHETLRPLWIVNSDGRITITQKQ